MERILQWISDKYRQITSRIPLRVLHFAICFCAALFSLEFALGLAIGRESGSFVSVDKIRDSLGDLLADMGGILLAWTLKFVF